jgi:hypothetical protein
MYIFSCVCSRRFFLARIPHRIFVLYIDKVHSNVVLQAMYLTKRNPYIATTFTHQNPSRHSHWRLSTPSTPTINQGWVPMNPLQCLRQSQCLFQPHLLLLLLLLSVQLPKWQMQSVSLLQDLLPLLIPL